MNCSKLIKQYILTGSILCIILVCQMIFGEHIRKYEFVASDVGEKFALQINNRIDYNQIQPWYDSSNQCWYYFVPSDENSGKIYYDRDKFIDFKVGEIQSISYQGKAYDACIVCIPNLYSLFISTESGETTYIDENKGSYEKGTISVVSPDGVGEYRGPLTQVKARGNATWYSNKKAYSFELEDAEQVAGLSSCKKYNLLALSKEGDKIHSKIAYDMASILNDKCYIESDWVNLYVNGEYRGLYLLTQSVKDRVKKKLGKEVVLLEKELDDRCDNEVTVSTSKGQKFIVTLPKDIDSQSLDSISEKILDIEKNIYNKEEINDIDWKSFASQYLIDEISLQYDAFVTSDNYYIKDDVLYAGPAWDYDGAFGEYLHYGEEWVDYTGSVVGQIDEQLQWWKELLDVVEFNEMVSKVYADNVEELFELYSNGIDQYSDRIEMAVFADYIRWKNNCDDDGTAGIYQTWDSNVRYLKFFLYNRLNNLNERYGIDKKYNWIGNGIYHKIIAIDDGQRIELEVPDGTQLENKSDKYDNIDIRGFQFEYSEEYYSEYLPILEDCIFY